jgi:L-2-hydroxyglutarate oxidase LhgO
MSAPHHDTRIINGTPWLLFGSFAGWSPKFLKQGHLNDLPLSVKPNHLDSMLDVMQALLRRPLRHGVATPARADDPVAGRRTVRRARVVP